MCLEVAHYWTEFFETVLRSCKRDWGKGGCAALEDFTSWGRFQWDRDISESSESSDNNTE